MKNLIKKSIFILFALFLLAPINVWADGMIIPPPYHYVYETDQKAVIFYEKGVETLILSITSITYYSININNPVILPSFIKDKNLYKVIFNKNTLA